MGNRTTGLHPETPSTLRDFCFQSSCFHSHSKTINNGVWLLECLQFSAERSGPGQCPRQSDAGFSAHGGVSHGFSAPPAAAPRPHFLSLSLIWPHGMCGSPSWASAGSVLGPPHPNVRISHLGGQLLAFLLTSPCARDRPLTHNPTHRACILVSQAGSVEVKSQTAWGPFLPLHRLSV